ncbi:alpha-amylase [Spirochaetia bacterium]|nr:alpha-amylase [Spirochaetia bacterium]
MPKWLDDAVFYEIYPQSFLDTNGDGIGDFEGIIQKLEYIEDLGCNALWLNPCFDSPFMDAGYDVRNYKKTAPRYGSNDDLKRLFAEAHKRGIRVLLDLVPGHTSEEHEWFRQSQKAKPNEYWNRYVWTDQWWKGAKGFGYVAGVAERSSCYVINFFKCQPALNYGFLNVKEPWQLPVDHPDCIATREAMKDVMRFWLDSGCDGFRVDMAGSLVKNDDPQQSGTAAIWRNVREMLDAEYPEAAMVAEWSRPEVSLKAGFHMDFLLSSENPGYQSLLRDYTLTQMNEVSGEDHSFFKKDGNGDITRFLSDYLPLYTDGAKNGGHIALITCNHDTVRPRYTLSPQELALAYAVIFTLPGTPFLYYGDEIGMRYLNLPTKEGGYFRTGSRTPMQWNSGKNLGFSTADASMLYLPVDTSADAPTVEEAEKDSSSLLNTVKALLKLRHAEGDLQSKANFEILYAEKDKVPFVYKRGHFVLAVNPSGTAATAAVNSIQGAGKEVFAIGAVTLGNGECRLQAQSFGIWRM